jgi:hypothetical protein
MVEEETEDFVKKKVTFDCLAFCISWYTLYGAMTAYILCLNFRSVSLRLMTCCDKLSSSLIFSKCSGYLYDMKLLILLSPDVVQAYLLHNVLKPLFTDL